MNDRSLAQFTSTSASSFVLTPERFGKHLNVAMSRQLPELPVIAENHSGIHSTGSQCPKGSLTQIEFLPIHPYFIMPSVQVWMTIILAWKVEGEVPRLMALLSWHTYPQISVAVPLHVFDASINQGEVTHFNLWTLTLAISLLDIYPYHLYGLKEFNFC